MGLNVGQVHVNVIMLYCLSGLGITHLKMVKKKPSTAMSIIARDRSLICMTQDNIF